MAYRSLGGLCLVALQLASLACVHGQAISEALKGLESSIQCYEEHELIANERPEYRDQRVCLFENLLVHNNSLIFVSSTVTRLPPIRISWEPAVIAPNDDLLQIRVVRPEELPRITGQVKEVPEAGLFHQQHTENFYHLFTEIAPTVHYILCKYLGRCSYQKHDYLRLYWVFQKRPELPQSMKYHLPPGIQDLFQCLAPYPVQNIYDVTIVEGQTLLLRKAVAGLARHARFYHQKKQEWRERWQDPPPQEYMQSYRQRVADCLGFDFVNAVAPTSPIRITFVNRHYQDGRHILNADRLREQILALPAVKALGGAEVDIVFLQGTLREQAQIMRNTSIYIWPHGATMAHTFFLPRGAQALEVVQWVVDDPTDQHIWVQGIRRAFDLQIGLDTVVNNDKSKLSFNWHTLMAPNSQYHKFNNTEKALLLEKYECPVWKTEERGINGYECFRWFHWGMSLLLDFDLLRPKLEVALSNLMAARQLQSLLAEQPWRLPGAGGVGVDQSAGGPERAPPEGEQLPRRAASGRGEHPGAAEARKLWEGEQEQQFPSRLLRH